MTFVDGESTILSKVRGEKSVIPAEIARMKEEMAPNSPYLCIMGAGTEHKPGAGGGLPGGLRLSQRYELLHWRRYRINAGPNLVGHHLPEEVTLEGNALPSG